VLRTQKSKPIFWGIVLFSLCFHGLIFRLPWPNESEASSVEASGEVPTTETDDSQSLSLDVVSLPAGLPAIAERPNSAEPSPPTLSQLQPAPVVAFPELPSEEPLISAEIMPPDAVPPRPQPQSQPRSQSQPVPSGSVAPTAPAPRVELPTTAAGEVSSLPDASPEYGMVVRLGDDFPHLTGAESGCYGVESCHKISGNFRQMAKQLITQLEAQGYQLTEREDIDDTGHRVFEVIAPDNPDEISYLNVYSPDVGSTVYVLTVDVLSLEQLKQLSA